MKNILLTILLLVACGAEAQNLIPNPDFSLNDSCPDSYGQIKRCKFWYSCNSGTPDYYNGCTSSAFGVPTNLGGYQDAPSHAYAGGYAMIGGGGILRENIVTNIAPLVTGQTYKVTIRVSLTDSSRFACDGFGVYFYTFDSLGSLWGFSGYPTPQIDYTSTGIVSDKVNWVTMTKQFVADSAYKHLCVGVLKPDAALHVSTDSTKTTNYAYYLYDSVAVERITGVGVTDIGSNISISQYPNPVTDYCTVAIDGAMTEPLTLTLFNSMGAVVRTMEGISNITTIYRDNLPTGIYSYKLHNKTGTVYNGRIVMQ